MRRNRRKPALETATNSGYAAPVRCSCSLPGRGTGTRRVRSGDRFAVFGQMPPGRARIGAAPHTRSVVGTDNEARSRERSGVARCAWNAARHTCAWTFRLSLTTVARNSAGTLGASVLTWNSGTNAGSIGSLKGAIAPAMNALTAGTRVEKAPVSTRALGRVG
jgi:hypothetical protein